ncbi:hypothetical protein BU16DRAFT_18688 [Lophium mytilinum]|uniref:Uncharacterized protein n=1 Tax=Lophium mytilinum TaxID=390894 RepID=A0A6A6REH4_9PEZI|nr:hypothetical protein BU16DRAFT_18688 [Lophium mytilinum]
MRSVCPDEAFIAHVSTMKHAGQHSHRDARSAAVSLRPWSVLRLTRGSGADPPGFGAKYGVARDKDCGSLPRFYRAACGWSWWVPLSLGMVLVFWEVFSCVDVETVCSEVVGVPFGGLAAKKSFCGMICPDKGTGTI